MVVGGISESLRSHCHEQFVVTGVDSGQSGKEDEATEGFGLSDGQVGASSKQTSSGSQLGQEWNAFFHAIFF